MKTVQHIQRLWHADNNPGDAIAQAYKLTVCLKLGHNGGPPLESDASWKHYCWKRAHKRAWKTPPREIALKRLARAEELGMSYRAYTLEILERGVYL